MSLQKKSKFNLNRICKEFAIDNGAIENCGIEHFSETLEEIYNDYIAGTNSLEEIKAEVLTILNDSLRGQVHSIRARVKNPDHLIEKIIRNVNEKPDKYSDISVDNYNKIITDLIGVRIIILNKHDWREIHKSLLRIFKNDPKRYAGGGREIEWNYDKYPSEEAKTGKRQSYHAEKPVVYITSEEDREIYLDENLKIDIAKKHYRSIHYIIRFGSVYFEIQVRTLFEEGWLEFDHRIKYPYDKDNRKKQEYIEILSSLAIAADRLISFYSDNETDFEKPLKSMTKKTEKPAGEASSQTLHEKMTMRY